MRRHKSRLELEIEKAVQARLTGKSDSAVNPGPKRRTTAARHAADHSSGLTESLLVHKSRLERERDAVLQAKQERPPPKVRAVP